jgi:HAD superfamily hydrolase (TIGR01549 family)
VRSAVDGKKGAELARYDAVTFDMGKTLVWFDPPDLENSLRAYCEVGLELDRDSFAQARSAVWAEELRVSGTRLFEPSEEYSRQTWIERERVILARLGIQNDAILGAYFERYQNIYREPGRIRTYAGVHEVLSHLRVDGYRLGIISNWGWDLPTYCELVGIAEYFDCIVASGRVGREKPHPGIFRHALVDLHVNAGRAVHVGDLYRDDIVGARGAGMAAILIDREDTAGEVDCPVIRELPELLSVLRDADAENR